MVRLLYESIGETLVAVDLTDPDWPRQLTLKSVKTGLAWRIVRGRLVRPSIRQSSRLLRPRRKLAGTIVVNYRNSLAHRIRPSVDHAELSPVLQDRIGQPVYDQRGMQTGTCWPVVSVWRRPTMHSMNCTLQSWSISER